MLAAGAPTACPAVVGQAAPLREAERPKQVGPGQRRHQHRRRPVAAVAAAGLAAALGFGCASRPHTRNGPPKKGEGSAEGPLPAPREARTAAPTAARSSRGTPSHACAVYVGGGPNLSARADGGPRMRRGPRSARHEANQCRGRPSPRCRPQAAYPGTLAHWGPTGRHPCKGLGGPGGSPPCTCRGAHAHTTAPPRCGGWSTRSSRSHRPGVVPAQPAALPADRVAGSAARAARAPAVAASPRRCGGGQFPPGPRPVAAEPRPAGGSAHRPAAAPQWAEVWAGSPRVGCGSAGDGGALLAGQGQPVGRPEPRLQQAVQRQGRDERTPRRH